jgi:N-acetylmuramoyl-L-alanine amidase
MFFIEDKMAFKIVLDAGHGGYDNGASYEGRLEKFDNLDLTLAIGEVLAYNGYDVIFTRVDDIYLSPVERAHITNSQDADLLVSIHRNSGTIPNEYSGVQTLVYDEGGLKQVVAKSINERLESPGFQNLGIDISNQLAVLSRTEIPALLVEVGFINSDEDNVLFDERFIDIAYEIASGISEGIESNGMRQVQMEPQPMEPEPMEPEPMEPTPSEPEPMEPMPTEPMPTEPTPTEPTPTEPTPTGPIPSKSVPMRETPRQQVPEQNRQMYRIQVGLYRILANAYNLQYYLSQLGYTVDVVPQGELYAVQIGYLPTIERAQEIERVLKLQGFDTLIVAV